MRSSPEVSMTGDKALISKIQRYSTKDGPGLRTTVFFMGCSLRCNWCANPETLSAKPQVYYFKERCQHCGKEVDYDKEIFRIPTWREQWTKWKGQFKAWKEQVLKKEP